MPYEVELVPSLFSSRLLIIDEESVIYGDTQMMFSEITGIVYGTDQNATRLVGSKDSYFIRLQDSSGDELEIEFYSTVNLLLNAEQVHQELVNEMWSAFGVRIYNEILQNIKAGRPVYIGPLTFHKNYVELTVKSLFGNEEQHAVPWKELDGKLNDNELVIHSKTVKNVKVKFLPARVYNGMMVFDIFKEMCGNQIQQ
jgi:hypothetical protein